MSKEIIEKIQELEWQAKDLRDNLNRQALRDLQTDLKKLIIKHQPENSKVQKFGVVDVYLVHLSNIHASIKRDLKRDND